VELFKACVVGDEDAVRRLIVADDVNFKAVDPTGSSALHIAADNGHTKIVEILIHYGIDINAANNEGQTALMLATRGGFLHIVRFMLQFAVNLKLKDKQNKTVFDYIDRSLGSGVAHALELAEEGLVEKRVKSQSGQWTTTTVQRETIKPNVVLIKPSEPKPNNSNVPADLSHVSRDDWDVYCNNPANRHMVQVKDENNVAGEKLTIVSYNTMAEAYSFPKWYPWTSSEIVRWPHRSDLLRVEIEKYIMNELVDVFCLQEIDETRVKDYWGPFFKQYNYEYVFKLRPAKKRDGLAVFYRPERLVVEKSIELSYNNFVSDPDMKTNNIALIIFFAFKDTKTQFCVADTHLNYKDVKITMSQVTTLHTTVTKKQHDYYAALGPMPTFVCGDFNAPPTSPVYAFMKEKWNMTSAYNQILPKDRAFYTSFTDYPKMIDYIWYNANLSEPISYLSLPEKVLLPNLELGSDHVALLAKFVLKKPSKQ
jgi:mRNA deadenylase 3'-5' endonuclease subunit Ccr4